MKHDDDNKEEQAPETLSEDSVSELLDDESDTDDEPITPESDFEEHDY
jgi:hypothetical protein